MNILRQYLESSTIQGLGYVLIEKRFGRLFWIFVVFLGFTLSGLLIKQSFTNWSESPIRTTIETRPISELTFPKVTVCPPENTFTDLNFDLMMLENMTLTDKEREKLSDIAMIELNDHFYQEVLKNMSKLEEENKFFNWYQCKSELQA